MCFVAENTTIPVPKVLFTGTFGRVNVIKMQYVKGIPVCNAWRRLTKAEQTQICLDLEGYVKQLRSLQPPSPGQVSSTFGGWCRDHRIGVKPIGPFQTHDDFHRFLRGNTDLDSHREVDPAIFALHSGSYASHFTHADLAPHNVIVRNGRIVAIIDWECSGWRPEYYEYTRAHFNPFGVPDEWFDAIRRATGEYDMHLKGERRLWVAHEFPSSPVIYFPKQQQETSDATELKLDGGSGDQVI
ncbi:kinase-like domain-containing protein [Crassisporium funariophilum]|nr:kinase-like domain-containing protein [Crassisporium funariophilum]